jgi:hypothetical protein
VRPVRITAPTWLRREPEAVYLTSDGDRVWIRVKLEHDDLRFLTRVESGEDWKSISPFPDKPGWEEVSLKEWLESSYGELFIDIQADPESHMLWNHPTSYMGVGQVEFKGVARDCLKLKTFEVLECSCTGIGRRKMLGGGPGKCPSCGGVPVVRRRCSECGGTGTCSRCGGKGELHAESYIWFDAKTGIRLKGELLIQGELVSSETLERLDPDVLSLGTGSTSTS